jgi:glucosamine--fructose-6-phosphate aminotransferase (isomerizing)
MPKEQRPATALERAIRSQPEELARIAAQTPVHAAVERLHRAHRIWLVGTGTSQHAAELGAAMLNQAGRAAQAVPSMHFVTWAPHVAQHDGVVVISHNAGDETAYAATARLQSLEAGLRVVSITRQGRGLPEAVETVPKEQSHTYTASYTGALMVLAKIAAEMGAESFSAKALAAVSGAASLAIADSGVDAIPQPNRLLVIAGVGPASVTAREGALKVREAARFPAEGYDAEYLLHGSAVPLAGEDRLVFARPPDDNGFLSAMAKAAEGAGVPTSMVTEPSDLPPLLAQIPLTIRLQLLALRYATERGFDPDLVIDGPWADEALWTIGAPKL